MRTSDPGKPDDDTPREQMSLWNNYEDSKVGLEVRGMRAEMTPEQAREKADALEAKFCDSDGNGDPETEQFISDLRERADAVEGEESE